MEVVRKREHFFKKENRRKIDGWREEDSTCKDAERELQAWSCALG
jgi:hypothetical protein